MVQKKPSTYSIVKAMALCYIVGNARKQGRAAKGFCNKSVEKLEEKLILHAY